MLLHTHKQLAPCLWLLLCSHAHLLSHDRSHDRRTPVYRVLASDKDTGVNGEITYSLRQASERTHWRIDSNTGEIYLKHDWPQEDGLIIQVIYCTAA